MHGAKPDPYDVALYRRARICQVFPAYTMTTARKAGREVLQAMELLNLAESVQS